MSLRLAVRFFPEAAGTASRADRREGRFGEDSAYYRLYREDPVRARMLVWDTFRKLGRRIRETSRALGCSRNTVRDVLRRMESENPVLENRPTRPRRSRRAGTLARAGC